jgi:hypothetical protein
MPGGFMKLFSFLFFIFLSFSLFAQANTPALAPVAVTPAPAPVVATKTGFCNTNSGKMLTLMSIHTFFMDGEDKAYVEIRTELANQCEKLEKSGAGIEKIVEEVSMSCQRLIYEKVKTEAALAHFRSTCAMANVAGTSYMEGAGITHAEAPKSAPVTTTPAPTLAPTK